VLLHWKGYDGQAGADHRGHDEIDASIAGALAGEASGSGRILCLDVAVPGSERLAVESDDEVGHGVVTVSPPSRRFRVV
jgi:hypothetical protein